MSTTEHTMTEMQLELPLYREWHNNSKLKFSVVYCVI